MFIQYYPSLYSGFRNRSIDSWDLVENAIKFPQTQFQTKEAVPLWSFYTVVDNPELNEWGEPRPKASNVTHLHALQIDYDDGVTIDAFHEHFKEYKYYLYTTFRHSDESNRFRVIIPLDARYSNKLLHVAKNRELIANMFPGCDLSTINSFRKQKIPAINPQTNLYRYIINPGKLFVLPFLAMSLNHDEYERNNAPREYVITNDDILPDRYYNIKGLYIPRTSDPKEATRRSVESELNGLPWGHRGTGIVHHTLCRLYGKLRRSGHEPHEATSILQSNAPRDAWKEISDLSKLN